MRRPLALDDAGVVEVPRKGPVRSGDAALGDTDAVVLSNHRIGTAVGHTNTNAT